MANFIDEYKSNFEKEIKQFLFLCDANDVKILMEDYKKEKLHEYVRLACIVMVFGYRRIFLRILATVENDLEEFLKCLDSLDGNFILFDGWIVGFINGIKDKGARKLAREYWKERKMSIDKDNFTVKKLF